MIGVVLDLAGEAARVASQSALGVERIVRTLPGLDRLPGQRLSLGLAIFLQAKGSDMLDFLGETVEARAETLDSILDHCTEEELGELMEAFQAAFALRHQRLAKE